MCLCKTPIPLSENAGTLDGVIGILNPGSPELLTKPIEGVVAIKAATLPVTLEYVTANQLT